MKKIKIISLIILTLGIVSLVLGISLGLKANEVKEFFTNGHKYNKVDQVLIDEEVNAIIINSDIRVINIISNDQENITIDYYKQEDETFEIDVLNNELIINQKQKQRLFSFTFTPEKYLTIDIKVPKQTKVKIDIKSSTGSVSLKEFIVTDLNVNLDTGSIKVEDINVLENTTLKTSTGSIRLKNSNIINGKLNTSTGSVYIDNVEATNVEVNLSTGDIKTTKLNAQLINLKTSTGSIKVEGLYNNHTLDLRTNTGSVKVDNDTKSKEYYLNKGNDKIVAHTNTGSINIKTK